MVVRAPELNRCEINRLLEAGAAGIQLARGSSDALTGLRTLVSYPPLRWRSVSLGQPATNYGIGVSLLEHFERSNRETLAVGQFEPPTTPWCATTRWPSSTSPSSAR